MTQLADCYRTGIKNLSDGVVEIAQETLSTAVTNLTTPLIDEIRGIEDALCTLQDRAGELAKSIADAASLIADFDTFLAENFCPDIEQLKDCLTDIKSEQETQLNELPIATLEARLEVVTGRFDTSLELSKCAGAMLSAIAGIL